MRIRNSPEKQHSRLENTCLLKISHTQTDAHTNPAHRTSFILSLLHNALSSRKNNGFSLRFECKQNLLLGSYEYKNTFRLLWLFCTHNQNNVIVCISRSVKDLYAHNFGYVFVNDTFYCLLRLSFLYLSSTRMIDEFRRTGTQRNGFVVTNNSVFDLNFVNSSILMNHRFFNNTKAEAPEHARTKTTQVVSPLETNRCIRLEIMHT